MQICGGLMLGLACRSYHLHHELPKTFWLFFIPPSTLGKMTSAHLPIYEPPFPQSGFTPRISNNKVSSPPGARPPMVRHLLPGMEEALLIRGAKAEEFQPAPHSCDAQRRWKSSVLSSPGGPSQCWAGASLKFLRTFIISLVWTFQCISYIKAH